MIAFKTATVAAEWGDPRTDPRVRLLVWAVEEVAAPHGVDELELTDVWRPYRPEAPGSPHPYWRAADISVRGWSRAAILAALRLNLRFQDPRGEVLPILLEVRSRAELDELMGPDFPAGGAVLINPDASGPHLHVQVPPVPTPDWEILPGTGGIAPELEEAPVVHDDQPQEGPGIRALIDEVLMEPAPPAERISMPDGIDTTPEDLDVYDAERLEKLRKGSKGFQNEPGFRLHRLKGYVLVPVVECSSTAKPTPQDFFVSPFELDQEEPELEVAAHMACVRIHGRVVVGRRDDIAEVARQQGRSFVSALSAKGIGRALGWLGKLSEKLVGLFG